MNKIVPAVLIVAAASYTAIIIFFIWLTLGFYGLDSAGSDLVVLAVFGLLAMSPLAVWPYCLRRAAAWRCEERPPF